VTPEQRKTLERVLVQARNGLFADAVEDALTAALGTCGTCAHIRDGEPTDDYVWCHERSEMWAVGESCSRWEPAE
jgi:hypothetical protein